MKFLLKKAFVASEALQRISVDVLLEAIQRRLQAFYAEIEYCCQSTAIIIIIIIKTGNTGPSGKNKIVYKLLTQLPKHRRHGKSTND